MKMALFKRLKFNWNQTWFIDIYRPSMGTFICSCGQRLYTKVKGHLRSAFKIT